MHSFAFLSTCLVFASNGRGFSHRHGGREEKQSESEELMQQHTRGRPEAPHLRRQLALLLACNHGTGWQAPGPGLEGSVPRTRPPSREVQKFSIRTAPDEIWSKVVETLSPIALDSRLSKMTNVISQRRSGVHIVLDSIEDVHDEAAILRTAEGLGVQNVHSIKPKKEGPRIGIKGMNGVAMGAASWMTVHKYSTPSECAEMLARQNLRVIANVRPPSEIDSGDLSPGRSYSLDDPLHAFNPQPLDELVASLTQGSDGRDIAIVLGRNQGGTPSKPLLEQADDICYLPMVGLTQKLTISVTAAMCLYMVLRSGAAPTGTLSDAERTRLLGRWLVRVVKHSEEYLLREANIKLTSP